MGLETKLRCDHPNCDKTEEAEYARNWDVFMIRLEHRSNKRLLDKVVVVKAFCPRHKLRPTLPDIRNLAEEVSSK